jgi:hypothetical protein
VTEVIADEIAASLKWATVSITRTERSEGARTGAPAAAAAGADRMPVSDEPF